MTDQKHTKKIMVSSPNRYGKNFQSLNESIAYANEGKIILCASTTGEAIMISREKYDDLRRQRDELREALDLLLSLNDKKNTEARNHRISYQKSFGCFACGRHGEHADQCEFKMAETILTKTKGDV